MPTPYVRKRERARNHNGRWRKKRSDSGKKRNKDLTEHPHNRPTIVLDRDFFEHLLNALATQKFLYHVNADGLSEGEEKVKQMQSESQQAIDAAWRKGMDILYKNTNDNESKKEE
jgi:hypothetical protein